jgi:F-type H+-transporting ATPase subunit b
MTVSFAIVFGLLGKFGFPVITKMADERRDFIRQSLDKADEANRMLESIRQQSDGLVDEARKRNAEIIKQATVEADRIIQQAKNEAVVQSRQKLDEAIRLIDLQKLKAAGEIRAQVALLSVAVSEKILRSRLEKQENHDHLVEMFLDEIEHSDVIRN